MRYFSFIIGFILLTACSPQPSESMIKTAIAKTVAAEATNSAGPIPSITSTPTENTEYLPLISGCVKGASSLNIRSRPSADSESIGYLLEGRCVEVYGRNSDGTWLKIDRGWVSSYFLKTDNNVGLLQDVSESQITPTTIPTTSLIETITPTFDSTLVISGNPKDYLLQPEEIPDPYFLPGSDWSASYSNDKIIEIRGSENGTAYLNSTGRLEGWFVWYKLEDNNIIAPERIGCYIVFYKTAEGARLAISPQWHPVYEEAKEGKAELVDVDLDIGESNLVYIYTEQGTNQDVLLDYNIEFTYRNALTVITGYGLETHVKRNYLLDLAQKVLSKLEAAPLTNPY